MNRLRRTRWAALVLQRRLEATGRYYLVLRTTHPGRPVHVLALGPAEVLLCQVETASITHADIERLRHLPVPRGVTKRLCRYRPSGGWTEFTLS